jgi:hypothetical protein
MDRERAGREGEEDPVDMTGSKAQLLTTMLEGVDGERDEE